MIISIQHPGDETVLRLIVAHRELSVMGPGSHGIPSEPNRRQQLMQYMTKIIVLTVRIRICNKLPLLILFLLYFLSLSLPSYSHSSASPCSLSTSLSLPLSPTLSVLLQPSSPPSLALSVDFAQTIALVFLRFLPINIIAIRRHGHQRSPTYTCIQ